MALLFHADPILSSKSAARSLTDVTNHRFSAVKSMVLLIHTDPILSSKSTDAPPRDRLTESQIIGFPA